MYIVGLYSPKKKNMHRTDSIVFEYLMRMLSGRTILANRDLLCIIFFLGQRAWILWKTKESSVFFRVYIVGVYAYIDINLLFVLFGDIRFLIMRTQMWVSLVFILVCWHIFVCVCVCVCVCLCLFQFLCRCLCLSLKKNTRLNFFACVQNRPMSLYEYLKFNSDIFTILILNSEECRVYIYIYIYAPYICIYNIQTQYLCLSE